MAAAEAPPVDSTQQSSPPSSTGFDCNICLELAQDPVVTLCGHLFCWPCLYQWLHGHATCQECPVCKALVEEDKVVPLYGRGNPGSVDPRRKPLPFEGKDVPHRPQGQRPQTARPPNHQNAFNRHQQHAPGFNFFPGAGAPTTAARFGNFAFSVGFGIFPALFGIQIHGIPDTAGYGAGSFGFPTMGFHDAARAFAAPAPASDPQETKLSRLFMLLGFIVLLLILFV